MWCLSLYFSNLKVCLWRRSQWRLCLDETSAGDRWNSWKTNQDGFGGFLFCFSLKFQWSVLRWVKEAIKLISVKRETLGFRRCLFVFCRLFIYWPSPNPKPKNRFQTHSYSPDGCLIDLSKDFFQASMSGNIGSGRKKNFTNSLKRIRIGLELNLFCIFESQHIHSVIPHHNVFQYHSHVMFSQWLNIYSFAHWSFGRPWGRNDFSVVMDWWRTQASTTHCCPWSPLQATRSVWGG